jgi:dephospho-CoA kinase
MIKIGITGSIASGKTTASKIISHSYGPLFSADKVVKKLYAQNNFKKLIAKKCKFNFNLKFKKELKKKILENKSTLKTLERIIHPFVRKEMLFFINKNRNKKFLFFEIPLLIESKLKNNFNVVIFIKSQKKMRLKRYKLKNGDKKLFYVLDHHQLKDTYKMKFCDHVVVNNKTLSVLKKNLLNIMNKYE